MLCIIRSFLLNNLISLLHHWDCIRCGEAYTIQESNSTISVTISSLPPFSRTSTGSLITRCEMTHEKTSPYIPKYTLRWLHYQYAELRGTVQFVISTVQRLSREFHFYCTSLRTEWLSGNPLTVPAPVVRSRSKFLFVPDQHFNRDKGDSCRRLYLSFPFASTSHLTGNTLWLPRWGL